MMFFHGALIIVMAWLFDLDRNWQISAEQHVNQNSTDIRTTLGQSVQVNQQQSLAALQYLW
jgi:hypothetical protein